MTPDRSGDAGGLGGDRGSAREIAAPECNVAERRERDRQLPERAHLPLVMAACGTIDVLIAYDLEARQQLSMELESKT